MNLTLRDRLVAAFVAVALLVMVAVPVLRFNDEKPARFGWHMFSLERQLPPFTVILAQGDPIEINPFQYAAVGRSDLPVEEKLPAHLCDLFPDAVEILVGETDTDETETTRTVPCQGR